MTITVVWILAAIICGTTFALLILTGGWEDNDDS